MNSEQGSPLVATVVGVGASVVTVVGGSLNRLVVSVVSAVAGAMVAGGAVVAGAAVVSTALVAGVVLPIAGAVVAGALGAEGAPAVLVPGDAGPPGTEGAGDAGAAGSTVASAGATEVPVTGGVVETGAGGDRRAATEVVVCTVPLEMTSSLTSGRCTHAEQTRANAAKALPPIPIARRRPGAMPAQTSRGPLLAV